MSAPETFTQTVILVGRGENAWAQPVSCGADAATRELDAAGREHRWAAFTSPNANGRVKSSPIRIPVWRLNDITAVFEQEVTIQNDPRALGMNRTASGIALPS